MLAYLEGEVKQTGPNFVIISTNSGIGYSVNVPPRIIGKKKLSLFIYHYQTEKSESLYGFLTFADRQLFEKLLKVSGLGPKGALALLSFYEPKEILKIIETKDIDKMKAAPGIGPKIARKILSELTDSFVFRNKEDNLVKEALRSLGFSTQEVDEGMSYLDGSEKTLEQKITKILKERGKNV